MSYYFAKQVDTNFEDTVVKITEELKIEGFGIITEIDVKEVLKKKIDVDFRKYKILGACNPTYAHQALCAEDKVGLMLPCNVVVQELTNGTVEVSAIDPIASMQAIENDGLGALAKEVRAKLEAVIGRLGCNTNSKGLV